MASKMEQFVNSEAASLQNAQDAAVKASLTRAYVAGQADPDSSVAGSSTGVQPVDTSTQPVTPVQDDSSVADLQAQLQAAQAALTEKDSLIAQLRAQIDSLGAAQKAKMDAMHALVDQLESQFDVVASAPAVDTSTQPISGDTTDVSGMQGSGSSAQPTQPVVGVDSPAPVSSVGTSSDNVDGANADSPVETNNPIAPPQA